MKRIFKIISLLCVALLACSCVMEDLHQPGSGKNGEMVDCVISFGSPAGATIDIGTKSELGIVRESNVFNIYILIFEGNTSGSKKIYGRYFDGSNLNATAESNYWTVTNMANKDSDPTRGTIHLKAPEANNCTIVAVANMNPNDLDVSAGLLSTIQTFGQLQNIVATQVRSEIAANSGFFLMTAQVDGVKISDTATDPGHISTQTLSLKRLYAKVTFNVRVAPGPNSKSPLRAFDPYTWQVVNVPTCCYLLERPADQDGDGDSDGDAADSPAELFSTEELGFEKETLASDYYSDGKTKVSIHSFSFYMMENRHAPSSGISTYADRERREKPVPYTPGTYFDNGDYVYTDPLSAYVVITGKLVMGTSASGNDNATLDANVRYEIHLGNFTSNVADFNTERNHNYVYNIFIGGAEDIKAEVEAFNTANPLNEPEPGATGRVVVALEQVFDSDCHYSTQVINFHAKYMDPKNISWYVETPFNPEGVGGTDVQQGRAVMEQIDYKWVEFFVNEKDANGSYYSDRRAVYKPHDYDFRDIDGNVIPPGDKRRTMYVDELVTYLKTQKQNYDEHAPNDFDTDSGDDGPKISVTAFIDEYYYTKNPISNEYDPTLWKTVVNHPMRRMHILASSKISADKESSAIGSSFTLQQRSIQSIYAVHEVAGLQSAWGMEFSDDERETGASTYWKNIDMEDCGNTSASNGRLNSMKLWGILNPDGTNNMIGERWDKYLNLRGTNETAQLVSDYNYLRYSCLSRNRDNNGNEIIDADEIRWYMASDIQLIGVFLGAYGIEGDARLYQRSAADQTSSDKDKWRQHIIASNRYVYTPSQQADWNNSNKYPRIVWAEEGVNGSNMAYQSQTEQTTVFSTRCLRNLGYYLDGGQRKDITLAEDPTVEPNPYFVPTRKHLNTDGTITSPYSGSYDDRTFYEFDCSYINQASLREPVDHELIGHDEHSKMACLSSKFETAPVINLISLDGKTSYTFNNKTYNLKSISELNQYLDDSFPDLDNNFSVCPEGYRLPNVREMSLIWTALSAMTTGDSEYLGRYRTNTGEDKDNNGTPCRTHWSFGAEGTKKMSGKWGWAMSERHLLMANNGQNFPKPRCVKDL